MAFTLQGEASGYSHIYVCPSWISWAALEAIWVPAISPLIVPGKTWVSIYSALGERAAVSIVKVLASKRSSILKKIEEPTVHESSPVEESQSGKAKKTTPPKKKKAKGK